MAGKLWNMTFVIRAGQYFVGRLLRLTGLRTANANQNHTIDIGKEFHADLEF